MKTELENKGYKIIEKVYSSEEIDQILSVLQSKGIQGQFGVREFLNNNPEVKDRIFNPKLLEIINKISSKCKKSIKSIYFDKPPSANWIVNWHQDLTINLTNRAEVEHYKNWRKKDERTIVQPNRELLESIFTIRIHLDDCTIRNGALRNIEKSHTKGTINIKEWVSNQNGLERTCEVKKGGILIMKPLILHSSRRTENDMNRRVLHIEFTDQELPHGLQWKEKIEF